MKRYLFIVLGILVLVIGIIGIVIPGLPTTPFLLLSAALFARSSQRLLIMLQTNRLFGRYINSYRRRGGMTLQQKIYAISLMWCMVLLSIFLRIDSNIVKYILLGVALIGTIVMGFVIKTSKED